MLWAILIGAAAVYLAAARLLGRRMRSLRELEAWQARQDKVPLYVPADWMQEREDA